MFPSNGTDLIVQKFKRLAVQISQCELRENIERARANEVTGQIFFRSKIRPVLRKSSLKVMLQETICNDYF